MSRERTFRASVTAVAFIAVFLASCGGDGSLLDDASLTDTHTDTTITQTPTYTLSLNAGTGGTIAASPAGPTYAAGTIVALTAAPATGKKVSSWSGTSNDSSASTLNHVTMTSDKTVSVAFADVSVATYTLSLSPGAGGSLVASPSQSSYNDGAVVSLTATPDTGYQVSAWSGTDDDGATTNTNQVTMSGSNKAVSVSFVSSGTSYTLTWATPDNWGTISVSPAGTSLGPNSASYPSGTVVTVTADAFTPTWKFGCFMGTTENTTEPGTATVTEQVNHVTMNADHSIKAYFPYQTDTTGACPEAGF